MRTILIVHSDYALAENIARTLESNLECQTVIACRQKEGAAVLSNKHFDLIVTDTFSQHPYDQNSDRWRWLDLIHTIAPTTPILALTPYTRYYYTEYRWHGYLSLLSMPFKSDELIESSLRAIANKQNLVVQNIFADNPAAITSFENATIQFIEQLQ